MKKILIIGKNSYLGKSTYNWLLKYPKSYSVDTISVRDNKWKQENFSQYDTVINFVGLAHINNIKPEMKDDFYYVNRDLIVSIAEYAKQQGVKHFIHFSSMNVYGDCCDNIYNRYEVCPTSFYGDSKLQGDFGLQALEDDDFAVALIRPPFVYGKGCSGNYNIIRKIAVKTPVFPKYKNKKSMIYIDNLCELVRLVIDNNGRGIYTPQNRQLVSTVELVSAISKANGKCVRFTNIFNFMIPMGIRMTKLMKKAFGNDYYNLSMSSSFDWEYCVVDFEESIKRTE